MEETLLGSEDTDNALSDTLLRKLLVDNQHQGIPGDPNSSRATSDGVPFIIIKPKPGLCMKTRTDSGEKVFINICSSENVPEPKDITDDELLKVLESEDPTQFRIPMSIGEPHAELDKSGGGCTAYDVVVHPNFMKKMEKSELFRTFFLTIMCEGIENKYDLLLKRDKFVFEGTMQTLRCHIQPLPCLFQCPVQRTRTDWIFLKNRKSVGRLAEQHIRTKSKPVIMDMDGSAEHLPLEQPEKRNLIEEVQQQEEALMKKAPEPKFTIVQDPVEGHPEFLVAEIHLPKIKTASSLTLDIGEDRLVITTRAHIYHLDIFLPYDLISEECGAQFDRVSKILTVTMPVKGKSWY